MSLTSETWFKSIFLFALLLERPTFLVLFFNFSILLALNTNTTCFALLLLTINIFKFFLGAIYILSLNQCKGIWENSGHYLITCSKIYCFSQTCVIHLMQKPNISEKFSYSGKNLCFRHFQKVWRSSGPKRKREDDRNTAYIGQIHHTF